MSRPTVIKNRNNRNTVSFGRSQSNDVVLKDPYVSRKHIEIIKLGNSHLLKDLNSRNGTYVNNEKINYTCELSKGDKVVIGQTSINWMAYFEINAPESEMPPQRSYPNTVKRDEQDYNSVNHINQKPPKKEIKNLPNYSGTLVLGLLSLIFAFLIALISIILGIIGLAVSSKSLSLYREKPDIYTYHSYKKIVSGRTMAIIGIVLSVLSIIIFIVLWGTIMPHYY